MYIRIIYQLDLQFGEFELDYISMVLLPETEEMNRRTR